jgi:hypothetical protein
MKTIILIFLLFVTSNYKQSLAWTSESLDNWTLGLYLPEISYIRTRADGTAGPSIRVPVGTPPFFYEVETEGEGSITFWIYDPGKCIEESFGYGVRGPIWGLQNPLSNVVCVGIFRQDYLQACSGYASWTDVSLYNPQWFKDGLRAANKTPWEPGWYKWTVIGDYNNISFTLFDVDYDSVDGAGYKLIHGDVEVTIDEQYAGGIFGPSLGHGWNGFYIKGDDPSGIEDISVDVISGTGIFSEAGVGRNVPISRVYEIETWSNIKKLFR